MPICYPKVPEIQWRGDRSCLKCGTRRSGFAVGMFTVILGSSSFLQASQESGDDRADRSAALEAFAKLNPIDAHVHVYKDDPAFNALLKRLRLGALNICVIDDRDADYRGLEPQRSQVLSVSRRQREPSRVLHHI